MKIVVPMAGWGTRMRPHTWSKPKPLVSVAGKTSLEHLIDMFESVTYPGGIEYIFIVGPYLGELQIPSFVSERYPNIKAHFIVQKEMKGQAHAIWLARKFLQGPAIITFSDSIIESNFSFVMEDQSDGIVWVMPVSDPRRFGVAEVSNDKWVKRFIEKPSSLENNLAIVGYYFFREAEDLINAIEKQMARKIMLKGEYFLADAITIMIEEGAKIRIHKARNWLDTGTIDATLNANKFLLERNAANITKDEKRDNNQLIAPVFVHPSAEIKNSVIGPNVSIGPECKISQAVIQDSIIEEGTQIKCAALKHSLIGQNCVVEGQLNKTIVSCLNIGDNSEVQFEMQPS